MFPSLITNNSTSTSIQSNKLSNEYVKNQQSQSVLQIQLLEAAIESFVDGILILTVEGQLLYTNECAREMCRQLAANSELEDKIPASIWCVCESLIENRQVFPNEKIFMEFEVESKTVKLRIRAQWLQPDANEGNDIIVTLEDCNESSQNIAIAYAKKYGLTERETEVWLLRRANLSYKEIAQNLYITINTVKKHLKNIYAKQQEMSLCS